MNKDIDFFHLSQKRANIFRKWDTALLEFEYKALGNDIQVHWADTIETAQQTIWKLLPETPETKIALRKDNELAEIDVNEQLTSHTVTPANMTHFIFQLLRQEKIFARQNLAHLSDETLAEALQEVAALLPDFDKLEKKDTAHLLYFIEKNWSAQLQEANVLLTTADYIGSDGSICLQDNDAAISRLVHQCETLVFVVGIDKICENATEIQSFLTVQSQAKWGVTHAPFINFCKKFGMHQQVHIILLDNKRTELLKNNAVAPLLADMELWAATTLSAVFPQLSPNSYPQSKVGVGGAISAPLQYSANIWGLLCVAYPLVAHLYPANSLVDDIDMLMVHSRQMYQKTMFLSWSERRLSTLLKEIMFNRKKLSVWHKGLNGLLNTYLLRYNWVQGRKLPKPSPQTFSEAWKKKYNL
ncbi:MAG: LUD domain-containing protein [Chitinophagales bacterium]|nr:LUD domain-containing protein [Bacteroidota bacterium]